MLCYDTSDLVTDECILNMKERRREGREQGRGVMRRTGKKKEVGRKRGDERRLAERRKGGREREEGKDGGTEKQRMRRCHFSHPPPLSLSSLPLTSVSVGS